MAALLLVEANAAARQQESVSDKLQAALALAGNNKPQLSTALAKVPADQKQGMEFLIANMPEHDLSGFSDRLPRVIACDGHDMHLVTSPH